MKKKCCYTRDSVSQKLRRHHEQLKMKQLRQRTEKILKQETLKEPIEKFEVIDKKLIKFKKKKEGTPRCRKEIEADGTSAHRNRRNGCT